MDDDRFDLQTVALGNLPADLVLTNGSVLFPETGDLYTRDIAIKGRRIAAVREDATDVTAAETTVIDAGDRTVVPGFINPHVHVDSFQPFERTYHRALAGGTTTVITETSEFGSCFGAQGVQHLLDATADLPVRVFGTVPPQPLFDTFDSQNEQLDDAADSLSTLLDDDRIVGVGESPWIEVVGRSPPATTLYEHARTLGKVVSGHGTGCSGRELAAFANVITDDHEAISDEQVIERLEHGIHVIGRYGSFRDDITALVEAYEQFGPAELSLSTDWIWPGDIVDEGYMDAVIRRAVTAGIEPADAIRMATLNPARHFGLDERGSLSPGSIADIVVLDDLETVAVSTVLSDGEIVVEDGTPLVEPQPHSYPASFRNSITLTPKTEQFQVPTSVGADGRVRAIHCEGGTISSATTVEPQVEGDQFVASPERDVLKITLLDRSPGGSSRVFTGFLSGFGLSEGAVATSHTWQTPGIIVVGADDDAMRHAVQDLAEMGGGWVVRDSDSVRASLPTPIGARCAEMDVAESATAFNDVTTTLRTLGTTIDSPALILQSIPFTGIPALRMTFSGYADICVRETVGLDPDSGVIA